MYFCICDSCILEEGLISIFILQEHDSECENPALIGSIY